MACLTVWTQIEVRCLCGHGIEWGTDHAINRMETHEKRCQRVADWYEDRRRRGIDRGWFLWEELHHVRVYGAHRNEQISPGPLLDELTL